MSTDINFSKCSIEFKTKHSNNIIENIKYIIRKYMPNNSYMINKSTRDMVDIVEYLNKFYFTARIIDDIVKITHCGIEEVSYEDLILEAMCDYIRDGSYILFEYDDCKMYYLLIKQDNRINQYCYKSIKEVSEILI